MIRITSILSALTVLLPYSVIAPFATTTSNPVSVTWLSPVAGSTISNVITLSASAVSLAGPIHRVEYYVDGIMVSVVTNKLPPPGMLEIQ